MKAEDLTVIMFSHVHPTPPKYYGGVERVVHQLAEGLIEKGVNVWLIAASGRLSNGQIVEIGGFSVMTFKEILDLLSRSMNKKIYKIFIPSLAIRCLAHFFGDIFNVDFSVLDKDKVTSDNYMEKTNIRLRDFNEDTKEIVKNFLIQSK